MRTVAKNGSIIRESSEGYKNLYDCEASFDSEVKTIQSGQIVKEWVDDDQGITQPLSVVKQLFK